MAKLAINGGPKVFSTPLSVTWPQRDEKDEQAVLKVVRSGKWWRGGTIEDQAKGEVGRFERAFADFHGSKYGLCVSNGTVAVEAALRAAGVKAGDEVIVPALSFVVSASAALTMGAVPVFADCDPETLQCDPDSIAAGITPRTTAIVIVHFGGYPADLDRIVKIARKHKLALIEDCAHGQGSQWRGRGVGTYGDYGTFSFQNSKSLTCGEGGIILCRTRKHWGAAYRYHNLGRLESKGFYDFYELSTNIRLTDLQGALLNTQFAKFKKQLVKRQKSQAHLSKMLRQIGGLEPLPEDKRITRRGFYYYLLKYDAEQFGGVHRDRFREALAAEGVMIGRSYGTSINKYPLFQNMKVPPRYKLSQYRKVSMPVSEHVNANVVCSVHHPLLLADRADLTKFAEAVAKIKANADELR